MPGICHNHSRVLLPNSAQTGQLAGGKRRAPIGCEFRAPFGFESRAPIGCESQAPFGFESFAPIGCEFRAPFGFESRAPIGCEFRAPFGFESRAPIGCESLFARYIGFYISKSMDFLSMRFRPGLFHIAIV